MKLRLQGNELRLRLNQAEVAQFSKTGYVDETIEFAPGARLCYLLETRMEPGAPRVLFQNGELRIQVSLAAAQQWATTEQVGLSAEQQLGNGRRLSILIEKDFQCVHSPKPDPHAYPNPRESETRG